MLRLFVVLQMAPFFLDFLAELDMLRLSFDNPWCIGGDFNEVLFSDKRSKGVVGRGEWSYLGILLIGITSLMSQALV